MEHQNINYDFKIIKTLEDYEIAEREIAIWRSFTNSIKQTTLAVEPLRSITIKDLHYNRERLVPWGHQGGISLVIRTLSSAAVDLNICQNDYFRMGAFPFVVNAYLSDFNGARISQFIDPVRKSNRYSGKSRLSWFSIAAVEVIVQILESQSIHIIDDINFLTNKER